MPPPEAADRLDDRAVAWHADHRPLVTHDVADFERTGVRLLDPWEL